MERITVVLSLGSNFGNRKEAVTEAMEWLGGILGNTVCSDIYETPPVGHDGPCYLNAVVLGSFNGAVEELNSLCKGYELSHGRDDESRKFRRVPIDIDIVIAGDKVMRQRDYGCSFFKKGFDMVMAMCLERVP